MNDSDLAPLDGVDSRFHAPFDPDLDRRKGKDPIKEYIGHKIGASEERIKEEMRKQFAEMRSHFDKQFKDAFPEGDPHGHRMYHERSIADAEKWGRIKAAVLEKLLTGGAWGVLAFLAYAAWEFFKSEVKK